MVVPRGRISPSMIPPSRKRRYSPKSTSPSPTDNAAHAPSKKRKLRHPTSPPPEFWDNLAKQSQIPLTKNAVRELNRRNTRREQRDVPLTPVRRSRRAATRQAIVQGSNPPLPVDRFLRECSSPRLKQLKKSASHGGPDLRDLRGHRAPPSLIHRMRSSTSSSLGRRKRGLRSSEKSGGTPNTTTTRSTGPYDRAFHQHLIDHGIYPDRYKYPDGQIPRRPENLEEIRHALRQPRRSLSPSQFPEDRVEEFQLADADASKESQVITDVIPFIEGDTRDRKCIARQVPCTNLDHLTDGTLVAASPDIYYGSRPEQLDRGIREELSRRIVPSTQQDLPVAPNFFVEVKGRDGTAAVASRQINYDMALGERGQAALLAYKESSPTHNNQAHTLGCTYLDGTLKMYATHMIQPYEPKAQPRYVMTQVKAWALTGDSDSFREGATAYRNARDWARRQRDQAIKQANEKATIPDLVATLQEDGVELRVSSEATVAETVEQSQVTITNDGSNPPSFHNSDTSADELSLDFPPGKRAKGIRKMPTSSSRSRQSSQDGRKQTGRR